MHDALGRSIDRQILITLGTMNVMGGLAIATEWEYWGDHAPSRYQQLQTSVLSITGDRKSIDMSAVWSCWSSCVHRCVGSRAIVGLSKQGPAV